MKYPDYKAIREATRKRHEKEKRRREKEVLNSRADRLDLIKQLWPEGKHEKVTGMYYHNEYCLHIATGKWVNYQTKETGNLDELLARFGKKQENQSIDPIKQIVHDKWTISYHDLISQLPKHLIKTATKTMRELGYRPRTIVINGQPAYGFRYYSNPIQLQDKAA